MEVPVSINGSLKTASQKSECVSTRHTAFPRVQSMSQSVPSKRTAVPAGVTERWKPHHNCAGKAEDVSVKGGISGHQTGATAEPKDKKKMDKTIQGEKNLKTAHVLGEAGEPKRCRHRPSRHFSSSASLPTLNSRTTCCNVLSFVFSLGSVTDTVLLSHVNDCRLVRKQNREDFLRTRTIGDVRVLSAFKVLCEDGNQNQRLCGGKTEQRMRKQVRMTSVKNIIPGGVETPHWLQLWEKTLVTA